MAENNSEITRRTQNANRFGTSAFDGEYSKIRSRHSQFLVLFNVDEQRRVYKLARNTHLERTFSFYTE